MSISRDNFDLPTSSIKMLSVFGFSSDKELTDNCIALMRLMIAHIIWAKNKLITSFLKIIATSVK